MKPLSSYNLTALVEFEPNLFLALATFLAVLALTKELPDECNLEFP